MKIWSVFSLVIVFHVVVIGLLLIQPGCQSQPARSPSPADTAVRSSTPTNYQQASASQQQLDPAFNSGLPAASSGSSRPGLSTPTRPTGNTRPAADTSGLTPVLDPVQDELSLPSIQSEYTVKRGDNLTTIARSQGVSLSELLSANGLTRNSTIYVGQKLVIPAAASSTPSYSPTPTVSAGKQVVVARGDSLGKIASRAGTTVSVLKSLNGLTSDTIYVGQKLMLPDSADAPGEASTPQPSRSVTTNTAQATYTVQPGDTPSGIARKYGISTSQLMAANGISDPTKLNVGKVLMVPGGGAPTTSQPTRGTTSQPMRQRNEPATTAPEPVLSEPTSDDPMSILEALEDEDIPFAEVEVIEGESQPGN